MMMNVFYQKLRHVEHLGLFYQRGVICCIKFRVLFLHRLWQLALCKLPFGVFLLLPEWKFSLHAWHDTLASFQWCMALAESSCLLFAHGKLFSRHHRCKDSWLATWFLVDQSMTKACVMTFGDICIFICWHLKIPLCCLRCSRVPGGALGKQFLMFLLNEPDWEDRLIACLNPF